MDAATAPADSVITLRLVGDLTPDSMPLPKLLELLAAFAKVVQVGGAAAEDLHLTQITSASVGLNLVPSEAAASVASYVIGQLGPGLDSVDDELKGPVQELRAKIPHGTHLELRQAVDGQVFEARLTRLDVEPPKPPVITGWTVVYGILEGILAGKQPTARLRVPGRERQQHVKVTKEQARQLGPMITGPVKIEGLATWDSETWEILELEAKVIHDFEPISLREGLARLAEIAGSAWDDLDVDTYIHSIRGR